MKRSIQICLTVLLFSLFCVNISATTLNDTQIIKSDHWIYDAIYTLYTKSGKTCPGNSFPITVGELKFLLRQIDCTDLDSATTHIYNEVYDFLYESSDLGKKIWKSPATPKLSPDAPSNTSSNSPNSDNQGGTSDSTHELDEKTNDFFRFSLGIKLTPEFYLKPNDKVDWYTFRTDPYLSDNFVTIPVLVGFENLITMEADYYYGKNLDAARSSENWFNFPLVASDSDYLLPKFTYGSAGFFKDNWGLSFHIAQDGHTIGKTQTGSMIYNRTFETAAYSELNIYSNKFSYALDVSQVDHNRFLYLHHVELRPFDNFKLSIVEGGLAVSHFEIRFLNPFMLVHSYRPAEEYKQTLDSDKYEAKLKYCAYFGLSLEYVPCKNLRTYFLFSLDEFQLPSELHNEYGQLLPDAYGLQAGAELLLSGNDKRMWKLNFESVYTLPFHYIRQGPQNSLYRQRKKISYYEGGVIESWIGTPFGPDCFAVQTGVTCNTTGKWSAGLNYLFTIHGENGFRTFTDPRWAFVDEDGKTYYGYYPSVRNAAIADGVLNAPLATDDFIAEARNHWLSGTLEYRHDIALNGSYTLNSYFSFNAQFVYTFVFNNAHRLGEFQQGVELAVSATFKYF